MIGRIGGSPGYCEHCGTRMVGIGGGACPNGKCYGKELEREAHEERLKEIMRPSYEQMQAEILALKSDLADAVGALERHGAHDEDCDTALDHQCTCGFDESLAKHKVKG